MSEDPEQDFVVGEMYGTRDPRNQIPNPDDFAFIVKGIDRDENDLEVEFVLLSGTKYNKDRPTDTLKYDEYKESLAGRGGNIMYLG